MAVTRLTDVVQPVEFTDYIVQNTAVKSDFVESGIASRNAVMEQQLRAGADRSMFRSGMTWQTMKQMSFPMTRAPMQRRINSAAISRLSARLFAQFMVGDELRIRAFRR